MITTSKLTSVRMRLLTDVAGSTAGREMRIGLEAGDDALDRVVEL